MAKRRNTKADSSVVGLPTAYQLADARPHPNPGKAADGKRLQRLEPDPTAAPIGRRIFAEYIAGRGYFTKQQIRDLVTERRHRRRASRRRPESEGSGIRGVRNQRHLRPDQACRADRIKV